MRQGSEQLHWVLSFWPSGVLTRVQYSPGRASQVVPWGDMDALGLLQRKLDVDILVTGHTHEFKVGASSLPAPRLCW